MVIKQRLEQRQGQTIQMTPQLRHAIKLLELPNMDLMTYLQALCLENPLIRVDGPIHGTLEKDQDFDSDSYEYYWDADPMVESKAPLKAPDKTLKQHVQAYIDLMMTDPRERLIAGHFLDHLDANGYLTLDLEQVAQRLKCSRDILESLLKRLQTIEPTGLFSRTLQECLALQCQEQGIDTDILGNFFKYQDLFLKGDFERLQKKMSVSSDELKHFLDRIKQLNPKPGHLFDQSDAFLPSPDLIITLGPDQDIKLRLNERNHPCLIYEPGAFHTLDAKAKAYIKAKESEAGWLIHSLQQRRENLLKMGQSLIQQQEDFFRHGIMALKPLTLKSVAEDTGLHESTISRLKSNKYALTPYGMMELKSFFSVAVKALSSLDDDISATCVKNEIRMCIQDESEDKPFSDDQLVYELAKKGINISRRTVTKYREQLNIPSSYGRKRASKRRQFA